MRRLFILTIALVTTHLNAQNNPRIAHYAPVAAAETLKLLPPVPQNWKVTTSRASNQVTSWLLTIGQKSLEYTPPPDPAQPGKPPVTMKTSITLMDGGGEPMGGAQFENFAPGTTGDRENLLISNCPAIFTKDSAGHERLVMEIGGRFLVTFSLENQPPNTAKAWAKTLDVSKFTAAAAATKPMAALPSEVTVELVDELNPKNNRHTVQQIERGNER